MANLVIRNIDSELKRTISELAKQSGRSVSAEVRSLIRRGITVDKRVGFGTWLFNLVDDEDRGDDLVFECKGPVRQPPDFK
jgi:plasmid stability protein